MTKSRGYLGGSGKDNGEVRVDAGDEAGGNRMCWEERM